jgi:hypothetical protein
MNLQLEWCVLAMVIGHHDIVMYKLLLDCHGSISTTDVFTLLRLRRYEKNYLTY